MLYGLKEAEFYGLVNLFKKHREVVRKVILFGSRARGDFEHTSDIDLAVILKDPSFLLSLKDEMDQLPFIYTVDLIDYDQISNALLKKKIDEEGKTIFLTDSSGKVIDNMNKISYKFDDFKKALTKLHESLKRDAATDDLVLDGVIQRFEFTYELSWKLMKAYLEYSGHQSVTSPRQTVKTAFKEELIEQGTEWIHMLEDRNRTSHTYDHETALAIYENIKSRYIHLFDSLQKELGQRLADEGRNSHF